MPDGHTASACATGSSSNSVEDLNRVSLDMSNSNTSEKMRPSKDDLGPHASVAVQESNLLGQTATFVTPIYVDTDTLGPALITAVSRLVEDLKSEP